MSVGQETSLQSGENNDTGKKEEYMKEGMNSGESKNSDYFEFPLKS